MINYRARAEQLAAILEAAGWRPDAGSWLAPPGKGPNGPWTLPSAWKWHAMGEAFRELAKRGWDVPGEYVGQDATTIGDYPKHPTKSGGKFVRLSTALRREKLPPLRIWMCRPLFNAP